MDLLEWGLLRSVGFKVRGRKLSRRPRCRSKYLEASCGSVSVSVFVRNRRYPIEKAHIPREFLELRGFKLIVSASTFDREAFKLLRKNRVHWLIVNVKYQARSLPNYDRASWAKARRAFLRLQHIQERPYRGCECRKLIWHEEAQTYYCPECRLFIEDRNPLYRPPRHEYDRARYGMALERVWSTTRGKARRFNLLEFLMSLVSTQVAIEGRRVDGDQAPISGAWLRSVFTWYLSGLDPNDPPLS